MRSLESLENRILFHDVPQVASVIADDRGEILATMTFAVNGATVNKNSVQVYKAGADGIVGNADDFRVPASVRYTESNKRITIRAQQIASGEGYRVKFVASRMRSPDGHMIDGEFNNRFPSGNGIEGGNFEFQTKNDKSDTPLVRMSTSAGVITLKMFKTQKPLSVNNFLSRAAAGQFDNLFVTRSIPGFIVQLGSLQLNASNQIVEPAPGNSVVNEFTKNGVIHNTRGTIAYAKQGGNPDSATNQFFFNLADNSGNLDNQNGGFTVFAQVANSSSLAVVDAIAALDVVALRNDFPTTGANPGVVPLFNATGVSDVPVNDADILVGSLEQVDQFGTQRKVVTGNFSAAAQLVIIRRTARVMLIRKLG